MLITWKTFALFAAFAALAGAAEPPSVQISNRQIKAKLYLPNRDTGYYRGVRFDWSGVIASLEYKGHNYFGVWFPRYDPHLHDAITGPVEEFRSGADPAIDPPHFDEAKPGGLFLKIGVGMLQKPDNQPYSFARDYPLVNPGKWIVRPEPDSVQFVQELSDDTGYGYRYQKTVRLDGRHPDLILEHRLRNTGKLPIESDVYDHDFYVIDGEPIGPSTSVKFGFPAKAGSDLRGPAEIRGDKLVYLKQLQPGQTASTHITGFGNSVKSNLSSVENAKTGAGVRETGDHPVTSFFLWSIRTTVCPEAFIHIKVQPGKEARWTIRYHFYTIPFGKNTPTP